MEVFPLFLITCNLPPISQLTVITPLPGYVRHIYTGYKHNLKKLIDHFELSSAPGLPNFLFVSRQWNHDSNPPMIITMMSASSFIADWHHTLTHQEEKLSHKALTVNQRSMGMFTKILTVRFILLFDKVKITSYIRKLYIYIQELTRSE